MLKIKNVYKRCIKNVILNLFNLLPNAYCCRCSISGTRETEKKTVFNFNSTMTKLYSYFQHSIKIYIVGLLVTFCGFNQNFKKCFSKFLMKFSVNIF